MHNPIEIGNRLFIVRTKNNKSQKEVSQIIGVSQSYYSKIETGQSDMTLSILFKLSDYFDVPAEWIIGRKEEHLTYEEKLELVKFKRYLISKRKK